MAWAAAEGLLEGYGDGTVGPMNPVTRAQMAKFLTVLSQAF
ncbi:MAG: S-layer homology domain-containing protein [Oscillospiraceae bacterium]